MLGPADIGARREPILVSSFGAQEAIVQQIRNQLKMKNELILLYEIGIQA